MNNLIHAEMFKLKRSKVFWTLVALLTLWTIGYTTLLYLASRGMIYLKVDEGLLVGGPDVGPAFNTSGSEILNITLLQNPIPLSLILGTLGGFFISNDYAKGVMKNVALTGNSRIQIFFAKFIAYTLGVLFICCIWPVISAIAATILFGFG